MRHLTVLILALVALSIVACGDDDDDGGGDSGSAVSKDEFIEQADQICREGNAEFERLNEELDAISGGSASEQFAEAESLFREGVEIVDEGLEEFRALTPPPGDEETIDSYLDGVEDQRTYLEQLADAAGAGDVEEFEKTGDRLEEVAAERRVIAQDYGFEECGSE